MASGAGAAFDPEVVRVARDVPCAGRSATADARLRLASQGGADCFATELAELGAALENPRVHSGRQA